MLEGQGRSRRLPKVIFFVFLGAIFIQFLYQGLPRFFDQKNREIQQTAQIRSEIKLQISDSLFHKEFPEQIELSSVGRKKKVQVEYTLDPEVQAFSDRLLRSYKPDYAAVVLLNAKTGEVLSLNSFTRNQEDEFTQNLALLASYPAASIFKIIPATAAIDKYNYDHKLKIGYNGSNHTLYRRNVMAGTNRWSRFLTLEDAFALSVNTVFAKLALNKLEPHDIEEYTRKFLFNQPILTDFPIEVSSATVPHEKSYLMAEVASGFNKINTLSPIQGAMIAASISNEGSIFLPYLIQSLRDDKGAVVFEPKPQELSRPISAESAQELKKLMTATITKGTSRKSFRPLMRNKKLMPMELGGKTGSLTGNHPRGKVDWFVGYAIKGDTNLAIATITVNKKYWTVKSAHLAQEIFKKYYGLQALGKTKNSNKETLYAKNAHDL